MRSYYTNFLSHLAVYPKISPEFFFNWMSCFNMLGVKKHPPTFPTETCIKTAQSAAKEVGLSQLIRIKPVL
jgi:hypothetical protein